MDKPIPEFMVRVKLPSSGGYASSPSGDTEYEQAYKEAIFAAKPEGFEVAWPRVGERWPVDSEGYTWVRLYCTDTTNALAKWREQALQASKAMQKVKGLAKQILEQS